MVKYFLILVVSLSFAPVLGQYDYDVPVEEMGSVEAEDDYTGKYYCLKIISFGENKDLVMQVLKRNTHPIFTEQEVMVFLSLMPLEEDEALAAQSILTQLGANVELVEKTAQE